AASPAAAERWLQAVELVLRTSGKAVVAEADYFSLVGQTVVAVEPFAAAGAEELTLQPGDRMTVRAANEHGWLQVQLLNRAGSGRGAPGPPPAAGLRGGAPPAAAALCRRRARAAGRVGAPSPAPGAGTRRSPAAVPPTAAVEARPASVGTARAAAVRAHRRGA